MTYPNGRVLNYNYNAGLDSSISRLSSISDNSGTLESYKYLGLGTVVERDHPQTGVNETFISPSGGTGDAGDTITGLDRFGRIVEDAWINALSSTYTDDFKYGYDRDGNALYRLNAVNTAFSELYHPNGSGGSYDGFNQIKAFARGTLNGTNDTITSPSASQSFTTDSVGNFTNVTTNGTGQTRTSNAQNQLTSVSGATTPTYDSNGNLTKDESGQTYTYDAWGRLVKVVSGGNTVSYSFDAMGRRITETTNGTTQDLYFDGSNVIEERKAGSSNANFQYVWSPVATNTLVERDRDTTGGGTLNERLYYQTDANNNITAVLNTSGAVVERYAYTPFGTIQIMTAAWGTIGSSTVAQNYEYQDGRSDVLIGDYRFGAREYRPSIEVWMGMDPIGQGENLYEYVGNNPANATDPTGMSQIIRTMPYATMAANGMDSLPWYYSWFAPYVKTTVQWLKDMGAPYAANASQVIAAAGLKPPGDYSVEQTQGSVLWFQQDSNGGFVDSKLPIWVIVNKQTGEIVRVGWQLTRNGVAYGFEFFGSEKEMQDQIKRTLGMMQMMPAVAPWGWPASAARTGGEGGYGGRMHHGKGAR